MQKPCPPRVAHQSPPGDHPRASLLQQLTGKQTSIWPHFPAARLPHGAHGAPFPACCSGEGKVPFPRSQARLRRREPFTHRAPCLLASRQTLNWEEVILNIWGAHLRVGSRPHGAWRKWQYMQLCHFLG